MVLPSVEISSHPVCSSGQHGCLWSRGCCLFQLGVMMHLSQGTDPRQLTASGADQNV